MSSTTFDAIEAGNKHLDKTLAGMLLSIYIFVCDACITMSLLQVFFQKMLDTKEETATRGQVRI